MLGRHCISAWSSTQGVIALSSGEAELYAMLKGATVTIGLISLAADFGRNLQGKVHSDASAAIAIVNRSGVGKLRHIRVQYLWLQQRVADKDIVVQKVAGTENPADLMTKHLSYDVMAKHVEKLHFNLNKDRAKTAPKLDLLSGGHVLAAAPCCTCLGVDIAADEHFSPLCARGMSEEAPYSGQASLRKSRQSMVSTADILNQVTRRHDKPRRNMFTPLRVAGAPPARALTPMRLTRGTFVKSGLPFQVIDTWTARAEAHRELKEPWVGSTSFFLRHNQGTDVQFEGQGDRQPEKGCSDMYRSYRDCVFSCDVDDNGGDSWLSPFRTTLVAAAPVVSVPEYCPQGVISGSRGGCRRSHSICSVGIHE